MGTRPFIPATGYRQYWHLFHGLECTILATKGPIDRFSQTFNFIMTIGNFLLKFSIFLLFLSISFYYIPTNLLKDLLKVAYQKTTYYEQQAQTEPILKHEDKIAKPQILPAPRKIIAIADLHGDYQNTIKTFKMAGLINAQLEWNAGSSIFVQTGDIVDRVLIKSHLTY